MLPRDFGPFGLDGQFDPQGCCTIKAWVAPPPEKGRHVQVAMRETLALLDTGANHCVISPELAARIALATLDLGATYVAAGETAPTISEGRALLALGGPRRRIARVVQVGVLKMPPGLDLIIGMSLLSDGVFRIDGPAERWTWNLVRRTEWMQLDDRPSTR